MDIQNFTTYSEELTPEQLMAQLNEYLSAMTAIVLAYEGFLDKYEGDAIMAIFGVPVDQPDHALRACQAALEMQDVLTLLRKKWRDEGKPEFCARIGINSGPMIAGNIGGAQRFDYTVIGDAVNLASRIEGVNKIYGTNILVSEFTRQLLDGIKTRELDFIRVKGKTEPVKIYEVIAPPQTTLDAPTVQKLDSYARGLQLYRQKKWDEAIAEFEKCLRLDPEDGPSKVFIERCSFYRETPVSEDWDGVFEMESK
jgi:adenylate cyclase